MRSTFPIIFNVEFINFAKGFYIVNMLWFNKSEIKVMSFEIIASIRKEGKK